MSPVFDLDAGVPCESTMTPGPTVVTTPPPAPETGAGSPSGESGVRVGLELHTEDDDPPLSCWLDEQLAKAAAVLDVTCGNLELLIVDDEEMASLHLEYKDVEGTTDVLTFDLSEPTAGSGFVEGDIVICLDEARRQAQQRGHSVRKEALLYAVHGLLHLLGEDDHTEAAFSQMHQREDAVLTALGFGSVFDRDIQPDQTHPPPNA